MSSGIEIAFNQAFNANFQDGTYANIIDNFEGVSLASFCTGGADQWPTLQGDDRGSVLERVIEKKEFVCGYIANFVYTTIDGQVMLDTSDPENVSGALVDLFDAIGTAMGKAYGVANLSVRWDLAADSQALLEKLENDEVDAACARWAPDAIWNDGGVSVARGLTFSPSQCSTYSEDTYVWTLGSSGITTLDLLGAAISEGTVSAVCSVGSSGGGTVQECSRALSKASGGNFECTGGFTGNIFDEITTGSCQAVWGGAPVPEVVSNYSAIPQPLRYNPVTFFKRPAAIMGNGTINCRDSGVDSYSLSIAIIMTLIGIVAAMSA
jgi:hypothetical protein